MNGTSKSSAVTAPAVEAWVRLDSTSLHDLAGPVNQVCSLSELMQTKYRNSLDSDAIALLGLIQGSANRLQDLMSGLRVYMRDVVPSAPFRNCDANVLLTAALTMVRPAMKASGARVMYEDLPELYGDPGQITHLFANLIDNSIKFRGETVPEIRVSSQLDAERWVISFQDNGIGIDPRHHKSIFAVFKRVHNDKYPGAGVGLAIAKRIAEGHGGDIAVESSLGCGATFLVSLPKAMESMAHDTVAGP